MIEIRNLTKRYGEKKALDNISLSIDAGEIVGFLGPNGAGKSTTMNILTGYISKTEGEVLIDGFDILTDPIEAKKRIGYLPEQPPLYNDMTVSEYLDFVYELKGVTAERGEHLARIMTMVRIVEVKDRRIGNLSKGYRQRVGLAQALIGDPEVLILDEPTVGLDPRQIIEMRDVIKQLGKERTIILSTHIMQEVSAICDRVIIINNGKIIATDTPEQLAKIVATENKMMVRVQGDVTTIADAISAIDGVLSVRVRNKEIEGARDFLVETKGDVDIREALFSELNKLSCPVLMLKHLDMTLEQIFIKLTTQKEGSNATRPIEDDDEEGAEIESDL